MARRPPTSTEGRPRQRERAGKGVAPGERPVFARPKGGPAAPPEATSHSITLRPKGAPLRRASTAREERPALPRRGREPGERARRGSRPSERPNYDGGSGTERLSEVPRCCDAGLANTTEPAGPTTCFVRAEGGRSNCRFFPSLFFFRLFFFPPFSSRFRSAFFLEEGDSQDESRLREMGERRPSVFAGVLGSLEACRRDRA